MLLLSWKSLFERVPYFMRYLHNNNIMLKPKLQYKSDYGGNCTGTLLTFVTNFFFLTVPDFSLQMKFFSFIYKWNFFNSKPLQKHVSMTQSYILKDRLNKVRTKLKSTWKHIKEYSLLRRHSIQNIE